MNSCEYQWKTAQQSPISGWYITNCNITEGATTNAGWSRSGINRISIRIQHKKTKLMADTKRKKTLNITCHGLQEPYFNKSTSLTKHRASTSMYSLTFCIRLMSPERHHWKPAVQAAAVMLRTPPSTASQPRPLPIYGAQFWERPRYPPVTGQQRTQTPPSVRTMWAYHWMDASL